MNKTFKAKWNKEQKRLGYWNNSVLGILCVALVTCVLVSIFSGLNPVTMLAALKVIGVIFVVGAGNWVVSQVRMFVWFRKEVFSKKEEA